MAIAIRLMVPLACQLRLLQVRVQQCSAETQRQDCVC